MPTDLAPLRRLALYTLTLAAIIAGAIALCRIALPTEWGAIGITWLMLAAALLAPLAVLDHIAPERLSWPRDLLAGPSIIATLVLVWLLGFLGSVGLIAIALLALAGLVLVVLAELPILRPSRLFGWLVLAVVISVPLIGALDGTKYANFVADRLLLFGRADGDTLFHGALINALRYFGVTATGLDGVAPFSYHVGVHLLAGRLTVLTDADAIPALIALRCVLLAPLMLFAVACGGIVWARRRGAARAWPMTAAFTALLLTLGLSSITLGFATLNSESALLGAAMIALAWPAMLIATLERWLARFAWASAILLVLPISASKVSFGFVWAGALGWIALRQYGIRRAPFWGICAGIALAFAVSFVLFSPGGGEAAILFGTPFYVTLLKNGSPLALLQLNVVGYALMLIMWAAWRRPDPTQPAVTGVRARAVLEIFAIIFLLANIPGVVLEIPGGDATYFVMVFGWMAAPLLLGEILRQVDLRCGAPSAHRGRLIPALGAALVLACAVGLVLAGIRQVRLVVNTEALVRSGDLQYYAGTSQRTLRQGMSAALHAMGWSGVFSAPPAADPASDFIAALRAFRQSAGNAGSVYAAPATAAYWSLTEDCDGKSMLPMAVAGLPMVNGYFPDQKACGQEFALQGYAQLPADLGQALDDAGICIHAAAMHSSRVLVVMDGLKTRELACTP